MKSLRGRPFFAFSLPDGEARSPSPSVSYTTTNSQKVPPPQATG